MASATSASGVPLMAAAGARADQVGILVPGLEKALPAYGPGVEWRIWTYGPQTLSRRVFRGREGEFAMRIALNATLPQIELIEPLDGPSLYHEWLDGHGYGIHHLGFAVDDIGRAIAEMEGAGHALLQAGEGFGADGTGAFAYFDTFEPLGYIVEAIERPRQRRPPEKVCTGLSEREGNTA